MPQMIDDQAARVCVTAFERLMGSPREKLTPEQVDQIETGLGEILGQPLNELMFIVGPLEPSEQAQVILRILVETALAGTVAATMAHRRGFSEGADQAVKLSGWGCGGDPDKMEALAAEILRLANEARGHTQDQSPDASRQEPCGCAPSEYDECPGPVKP